LKLSPITNTNPGSAFNHCWQQISNFKSIAANNIHLCVVCLLLIAPTLTVATTHVMGTSPHTEDSEIVLTVTGKHGFNTDEEAALTFGTIRELPSFSFTTKTPWTEGEDNWEGVRLSVLLAHLGTSSTQFRAWADDGYEATFKGVDIEKYPVILAYKKNGEYLSLRDLGPLWIMFPFDDHSELDELPIYEISVWQLSRIEIL